MSEIQRQFRQTITIYYDLLPTELRPPFIHKHM